MTIAAVSDLSINDLVSLLSQCEAQLAREHAVRQVKIDALDKDISDLEEMLVDARAQKHALQQELGPKTIAIAQKHRPAAFAHHSERVAKAIRKPVLFRNGNVNIHQTCEKYGVPRARFTQAFYE